MDSRVKDSCGRISTDSVIENTFNPKKAVYPRKTRKTRKNQYHVLHSHSPYGNDPQRGISLNFIVLFVLGKAFNPFISTRVLFNVICNSVGRFVLWSRGNY